MEDQAVAPDGANTIQQDAGSVVWAQPEAKGEVPPGRSGHTMTVLGDKAYMFGGCDEDLPPGPTNALYRLHLSPPDARNPMECVALVMQSDD